MKNRLILFLLSLTNVCLAQLPCSVPAATSVGATDKFMVCQSGNSKYATLFKIIDTTKIAYIAQGRSSGLLKFNGTAWVMDNSTYLTTSSAASTYIPLAGSNSISGDLYSTADDFSVGINGVSYVTFSDGGTMDLNTTGLGIRIVNPPSTNDTVSKVVVRNGSSGYLQLRDVSSISPTFSNGLTESGGTVKWGGSLLEDTEINIANRSVTFAAPLDYALKFDRYDWYANPESSFNVNVGNGSVNLASNGGGSTSSLALNAGSNNFQINNGSSNSGIFMDVDEPATVKVSDGIRHYGIGYNAKYRTGIDGRWLTDKEYVDSAVAASGGGSGIPLSGSDIIYGDLLDSTHEQRVGLRYAHLTFATDSSTVFDPNGQPFSYFQDSTILVSTLRLGNSVYEGNIVVGQDNATLSVAAGVPNLNLNYGSGATNEPFVNVSHQSITGSGRATGEPTKGFTFNDHTNSIRITKSGGNTTNNNIACGLSFPEAITSGINYVDLKAPNTMSADFTVILPASTGTLATLAGSESLTNKKLGSLTSNGLVTTSGGDGTLSVTAMGTGMATWLATPSSANLASTITDETGSGSLVFGTSPTLSNPIVGTQSTGDNSTKAASTAYVDGSFLPIVGRAYTTTTGNGLALTGNSLTSGSLVSLSSTSTAATSNTQTILNISQSGANSTSTQTTYSGYFTNTKTGTSSTNVALYASATGGTNNYAAILDGNVGIGNTAPVSQLHISSEATGTRGITVSQHSANAASAVSGFRKSRGTTTSPATIANSDYIGVFSFMPHDGTTYLTTSTFGTRVNGTVSTGSVPTDFYVATSSANDTDPFTNGNVRLLVTSVGNVLIGGTSAPSSATKALVISSGTAPSSSPTDAFSIYSADISAGNAAMHTRAEGGEIYSIGSEFGTQSNSALNIATNSTNRLIISANGNTAAFQSGTNVSFASTYGILGTTTNDNASAGVVGEDVPSCQSTYTNYTTTATYQNIASITLTAGDWDIKAMGTIYGNSATLTAASDAVFVISTTTASASGATEGKNIAYIAQTVLGATSHESVAIPSYRVSISGTTTYYLNSQSTFTLGNPQFVGCISARRIR